MFRIDTRMVLTQMVNGLFFRERADVNLIGDSVCPLLFPSASDLAVEESVPVFVQCSLPDPARRAVPEWPIFTNLGVESRSFALWLGASLHKHLLCILGPLYHIVHGMSSTEFIGKQLMTVLHQRSE